MTPEETFALTAPLSQGAPLVLGVSGGADSAAMLRLFAALRERLDLRAALTVDHGLRAASAKEASEVGRWCAEIGLAHEILPWTGPKPASDIQAAARAARMGRLSDAAKRHGATLALAHTLEDQAETVLLRLARGSGVDGLSAMGTVADWAGARVIRPFLATPRARLRAVLTTGDWPWIEDPSNQDRRFDRIKARDALAALAPLGLTPERLAKTARTMARARDVLTAETGKVLARVDWSPLGVGEAPASVFTEAPPEIGLRALSACLRAAGGAAWPPDLAKVERAMAWLHAGGAGAHTLSGAVLRLHRGAAIFAREPSRVQAPIDAEPGAVWDGRFRIDSAPPGLRLGALGEEGARRLRQAEAEGWRPPRPWAKARAAHRLAAPALWRGDSLAAVPAAAWGESDVQISFLRPGLTFAVEGPM